MTFELGNSWLRLSTNVDGKSVLFAVADTQVLDTVPFLKGSRVPSVAQWKGKLSLQSVVRK